MYHYNCKVVRVIDADTVVLDIDIGFSLWLRNVSCRLAGINALEKNTPEGVEGWKALAHYLYGKTCTVQTVKDREKYGRYLVHLYTVTDAVEDSVNDWLVNMGYASYV